VSVTLSRALRCLLPLGLLTGCTTVFDLDKVPDPVPPEVDPCAPDAVVPDVIELVGQLRDSATDAELGGLSIDAQPGGVAPADSTGRFLIDVPTGEVPLFETLTASGRADYPRHVIAYQRPFTVSPANVDNKLLSSASLDGLYAGPRGSDIATALLSLRDCNGNGVADAQLAIDPASTVVYQGGLDRTNGTGVAYGLALPPGTITVTPTRGRPFSLELTAGDMAIVYLVVP
jgi:hypothetical protein